jgi:hypothetical protein
MGNALTMVPAVSGGAQQTPALDKDTVRTLDRAEQLAEETGDSPVWQIGHLKISSLPFP